MPPVSGCASSVSFHKEMKRVFWHSRDKHIGYFIGGLLFVSLSTILLIISDENRLMNTIGLFFFALVASFYLYNLLDPETQFIVPGTEEEKIYKQTTEGRYKYSSSRFTITTYDEDEGTRFKHTVQWKDIRQIELFKIKGPDLIYESLIIRYQDFVLAINQNQEGYFVLVERIKQNIAGIDKDWQLDAPVELFDTTQKIVFEKQNGSEHPTIR
jgi:hypothetical protein